MLDLLVFVALPDADVQALATYFADVNGSARRAPGDAAALARAARRGVAVRVLTDGFGARGFAAGLGTSLAADGVDVRLHGDVLTLSGRSAASEPERFTPLWREYALRDYERAFRLGQAVDPENITAAIKEAECLFNDDPLRAGNLQCLQRRAATCHHIFEEHSLNPGHDSALN